MEMQFCNACKIKNLRFRNKAEGIWHKQYQDELVNKKTYEYDDIKQCTEYRKEKLAEEFYF